jgi:hypothetical protein
MNSHRCGFYLTSAAVGLSVVMSVFAGSDAPAIDARAEDDVSRLAESFLKAWASGDSRTMEGLMAFPFNLIAPCKGGTFRSWDEFKERRLARPGDDKTRFRAMSILSIRDYAGVLRAEVDFVVHVCDAEKPEGGCCAVMIRASRGSQRVCGVGFVPRPEKGW